MPVKAWRTALWMWQLLLLGGFGMEFLVMRFADVLFDWRELIRLPALWVLLGVTVVTVCLAVLMWFRPSRALQVVCAAASVTQGVLFFIISSPGVNLAVALAAAVVVSGVGVLLAMACGPWVVADSAG